MERLFTISHADLLSTPSPFGNWKNPCPTIGEALAQLLEKPSPNYWKNPYPTYGEAIAQLLEKPSPNNWKNPTIGNSNRSKCPKIIIGLGKALVQQMSLLENE